jgi:hypothetical protein
VDSAADAATDLAGSAAEATADAVGRVADTASDLAVSAADATATAAGATAEATERAVDATAGAVTSAAGAAAEAGESLSAAAEQDTVLDLTGVEADKEPFAAYSTLTGDTVIRHAADSDDVDHLREVLAYERAHKSRKGVVSALENRLTELSASV